MMTCLCLVFSNVISYHWSDVIPCVLNEPTACLQAFIDKFRFNAKRASLVQSRIKAIERLGQSELIEEDPEYIFRFPGAEPVSPPILGFMDVDFGYPGGPTLFRNLNFGIDMESRFAMVGPNGMIQKQNCLSYTMGWFHICCMKDAKIQFVISSALTIVYCRFWSPWQIIHTCLPHRL